MVQVYSGAVISGDEFRPGVKFIGGQFYESDAKGEPTSEGRSTWVMSLGRDSEPKNLTELQGRGRLKRLALIFPRKTDQTAAQGNCNCLGTVGGSEFGEDIVDMKLDRSFADGEVLGDLFIRLS